MNAPLSRMAATGSLSRLALGGLVCLLACAGSLQLSAITYYIDFTTGSDSNNGTSKATPWKHHPASGAFSGSYVPAIGDDFVFRGGETWPNSCFPMQAKIGGNAGNASVWGVDQTWFTGAVWTQPKFDAGNVELANTGGTYNIFIQFAGFSYITIDNIEFTGLHWSGGNEPFQGNGYIKVQSSTNIIISNCKFLNWTHGSYNIGTENTMFCVWGNNGSPFTSGCVITNCVFDGINQPNQTRFQSSGGGVRDWGGRIVNSVVRNACDGFNPSSSPAGQIMEITGCDIGPILNSFDPNYHPDGIQNNGGHAMSINNNYIHDCWPVSIFILNGQSGETNWFFNNVVWGGAGARIDLNTSSGNGKIYIYNNTLVSDTSLPIVRATYRPTSGFINTIDMRNNLCITDGSFVLLDPGVVVANQIDQNNTKLGYQAALNAGYSLANRWKPVNSGVPSVNAGQTLSSFMSGALNTDILGVSRVAPWDTGAYEFSSGQINPGSLQFSSSGYSVASSAGTVTITVTRTGGTDGQVTLNYSTANGTAVAGTDYTATSGSVTFNNGVSTPQTFTVPIINSGATGTSRTFTVNASSSVLGSPSQATVTITLPPTPPSPAGVIQWAAGSYSVLEAGPSVALTARRINGTNGLLSATYTTVDGSALGGHDYTPTANTLSWPDGNAVDQTVTVPIIDSGDTPGTNRTFTVTLSGAAVGDQPTATVTIIMRDPPPPPPPTTNFGTLQFSVPVYYTTETNGVVNILVQRLDGTNGPVTVDYSTASGSAVDGTDFTGVSGTLSWADGANDTKTVPVTIINTGTVSVLSRLFTVSLSNATGGAAIGPTGTATISIAMNAPIGIRATINNAVIHNAIISPR